MEIVHLKKYSSFIKNKKSPRGIRPHPCSHSLHGPKYIMVIQDTSPSSVNFLNHTFDMFAVITQIPDSISKLGPALFSSVNCPVIACMTKSVTKYFNHGETQLHCVRTQIVIAPAAGVLFA